MAEVIAHNDEIRGVLQDLARIPPGGPPVVSLYLNTHWSDEQQRERVRLFVKDRVRQLREAWSGHADEAALLETLERMERYVYEDVVKQADEDNVGANGVVIFASTPGQLWAVLWTPVAFENQMTVSDRPRLIQLARLYDDFEPAFVVMVDPRWLRIFEIAMGGVVVESEMHQYMPDRVDAGNRGPWANSMPRREGQGALPRGGALSQMRYQHHIEEHIDGNLRNGAEFLGSLMGHEPKAHLILAGPPEMISRFRSQLSDHVEKAVIEERRLDDKESRHVVLRHALEILEKHEREKERKGVQDVVGLAMAGNFAVLGPEDTLMALNEGRVYELFIQGDGDLSVGWRCRNCAAIGRKAEAGCPYCGGDTTTVDLAEEAVRKAIDQGAHVDHVKSSWKLKHFHGMAARLRHGRQPLSSGLAHAEHEPMPPR